MISLCRIDAAYRRVTYYCPDLDLGTLSLDQKGSSERGQHVQAAQIRSALVARVADIVKQTSGLQSALDAAVAMIEILIFTYAGHGHGPGRGHNHAMQAIHLLASVSERVNQAIELFFDLVERFCLCNVDQIQQHPAPAINDPFIDRMMQNYDQSLIKLLSKCLNNGPTNGACGPVYPLERIQDIREQFEGRTSYDRVTLHCFGTNLPPRFFCDSERMLKMIQKKRRLSSSPSSPNLRSTAAVPAGRTRRWKTSQIRDDCLTVSSLGSESISSTGSMRYNQSIQTASLKSPRIESPGADGFHATRAAMFDDLRSYHAA